MRYEYRLVKEKVNHPDIGEYETAGIEVIELGAINVRTDFQSDVSTQTENVQLLVELLNRTYTSPAMFHRIVEDVFYS